MLSGDVSDPGHPPYLLRAVGCVVEIDGVAARARCCFCVAAKRCVVVVRQQLDLLGAGLCWSQLLGVDDVHSFQINSLLREEMMLASGCKRHFLM